MHILLVTDKPITEAGYFAVKQNTNDPPAHTSSNPPANPPAKNTSAVGNLGSLVGSVGDAVGNTVGNAVSSAVSSVVGEVFGYELINKPIDLTHYLHHPLLNVLQRSTKSTQILPKKSIKRAKMGWDHPMLRGFVKCKEQFDALLDMLPDDDAALWICQRKPLNQALQQVLQETAHTPSMHTSSVHTPNTIAKEGIYLQSLPDSLLFYDVSQYSVSHWQSVCQAVLQVFASLGAARIKIVDISDTHGKVGNVGDVAKKLGLNLQRKETFDLEWELEPSTDLEKARSKMPILQAVPDLYGIAEMCLTQGIKSKSIRRKSSLDVSFGIDLDMLTLFQGAFVGGYERTVEIEIDFTVNTTV